MKRYLSTIISIIILLVTFINVNCFAYTDIDVFAPTEGVAADGNIGLGVFDKNTSGQMVPYSEYGISDTELRIQYDESTNKIYYSYYTVASCQAEKVGMNPLQLQMWNSSTERWENIASGSPISYNTGSSYNSYQRAPIGRNHYYRIAGYHYARINGTDHLLYNETAYIYI